jgi:uncharacterized delta-60 repeat protein
MKNFLISLLLPILLFASVAAQPGSLDATFGNGGISRIADAAASSVGSFVRQADGKLIAIAGSSNIRDGNQLTRLNADGSLDTSFANGGNIRFNWQLTQGRNTYYGAASAFALQEIGGSERILVAGNAPVLSGKKVVTNRMRIVRLMPDGSFDSSWGVNGVLQLNLNGAGSIAVQPADQKIVVATGSNSEVIRLTSTGQVDSSFGTGGITTIPSWITFIKFDVAGRILVVGAIDTAARSAVSFSAAVTRLTANGIKDVSFGTNGTAIAGFKVRYIYMNLSLDSFGNVIVGTSTGDTDSTTDFAVVRFTASGVRDSTFGNNGVKLIDFNSQRDIGFGVSTQSDGKIVIVGNTVAIPPGGTTDMALARLDYYGNLDTNFGNGGRIILPHTAGGEGLNAVMTSTDSLCNCEKIFAAGINAGNDELLVAKFLEN